MFDDDAYIKRKKELSWYVINSSKNYETDLAENAYSQMVLDGIRIRMLYTVGSPLWIRMVLALIIVRNIIMPHPQLCSISKYL